MRIAAILGSIAAAPAASRAAMFPGGFHGSTFCSANAVWQSNLFLRDKALDFFRPVESDTIAVVRPGVAAMVGDEDSIVSGRLQGGVEVTRFASHGELDEASPFVNGQLRWDDGRTTAIGAAAYERAIFPSQEFRPQETLIGRVNRSASLSISHSATAASDLHFSTDWLSVNYGDGADASFRNQETFASSLSWRYAFFEKLRLGPGYRHRFNWVRGMPTSVDRDGFVAVDWDAAAGLAIQGRVGAGWTDGRPGATDASYLSLALDAHTDVTEKLRMTASVSRDLRSDEFGRRQIRTALDFGTSWVPTDVLATTLGVVWTRLDWVEGSMRENLLEFRLAQQVVLTRSTSTSLSVRYADNRSNVLGRDYQAWTMSLSASVRW